MTTRQSFFSMALARAHSEGFSQTFDPAHSWLAQKIQASAPRPYLFDIGCGDGRFLTAMGEMGIFGEGIDISAAFVAIARRRQIKVTQDSAMQAQLPDATTAVTALGEVFAYEPAALAPMAHRISRGLPAGGVLIFDLPGPNVPAGTQERTGENWNLTSRVEIEGQSLTRHIEVEFMGQKAAETHRQHLFTADEVGDILAGFGMEAEIVESYGPCPLLPGRFGVVAHKP